MQFCYLTYQMSLKKNIFNCDFWDRIMEYKFLIKCNIRNFFGIWSYFKLLPVHTHIEIYIFCGI